MEIFFTFFGGFFFIGKKKSVFLRYSVRSVSTSGYGYHRKNDDSQVSNCSGEGKMFHGRRVEKTMPAALGWEDGYSITAFACVVGGGGLYERKEGGCGCGCVK